MLKVMIAENDLLVADMLEESLLDAGYEVCGIACTVEEGVALGKLHKPDFAVLDLRLSDGGFGTEIAARLDRKGELGILYATGNAKQIGLSKDDGDACLEKPYRPADVVRALKIVGEIVNTGKTAQPFPGGFHLLYSSPIGTDSADMPIGGNSAKFNKQKLDAFVLAFGADTAEQIARIFRDAVSDAFGTTLVEAQRDAHALVKIAGVLGLDGFVDACRRVASFAPSQCLNHDHLAMEELRKAQSQAHQMLTMRVLPRLQGVTNLSASRCVN
jgi:CheY-like chemotaxis protein